MVLKLALLVTAIIAASKAAVEQAQDIREQTRSATCIPCLTALSVARPLLLHLVPGMSAKVAPLVCDQLYRERDDAEGHVRCMDYIGEMFEDGAGFVADNVLVRDTCEYLGLCPAEEESRHVQSTCHAVEKVLLAGEVQPEVARMCNSLAGDSELSVLCIHLSDTSGRMFLQKLGLKFSHFVGVDEKDVGRTCKQNEHGLHKRGGDSSLWPMLYQFPQDGCGWCDYIMRFVNYYFVNGPFTNCFFEIVRIPCDLHSNINPESSRETCREIVGRVFDLILSPFRLVFSSSFVCGTVIQCPAVRFTNLVNVH